uniref:Queuosine 5'-phosphate N-glycosylase/hydrolase n=1 Tax=Parascaris equorum TaxID=6256 RepID=A0A914R3I0_PAREQ
MLKVICFEFSQNSCGIRFFSEVWDVTSYNAPVLSFKQSAVIFIFFLRRYGAKTSSIKAVVFSELTMFADYRVPQALAYLGALHYSSKLLKSLRSNPILPSGCPLEMELRGFSIKACDVTLQREHAVEIEKNVPYHRVRSINY